MVVVVVFGVTTCGGLVILCLCDCEVGNILEDLVLVAASMKEKSRPGFEELSLSEWSPLWISFDGDVSEGNPV